MPDTDKPPIGLKDAGRRFWGAVVGPYLLTPAELALLEQACRTVDELHRLDQEVRVLPSLTTTGSMGQLRPHPLLAEVRAHRLVLERLTVALGLPAEDEVFGLDSGSRHARAAAQAQWRARREANRGDASQGA